MIKRHFQTSNFLRAVSFLTALFFIQAQTAVFAEFPQNEIAAVSQPSAQKAVSENLPASNSVSSVNTPALTTDFLQNGFTLEAVHSAEENNNSAGGEKEETPAAVQTRTSAFEQALDLINKAKGFAAAAVDKITQSDLAKLAKQVWEYGVTVIKGVILLFTSHDENRLETTAGFRKILDQDS